MWWKVTSFVRLHMFCNSKMQHQEAIQTPAGRPRKDIGIPSNKGRWYRLVEFHERTKHMSSKFTFKTPYYKRRWEKGPCTPGEEGSRLQGQSQWLTRAFVQKVNQSLNLQKEQWKMAKYLGIHDFPTSTRVQHPSCTATQGLLAHPVATSNGKACLSRQKYTFESICARTVQQGLLWPSVKSGMHAFLKHVSTKWRTFSPKTISCRPTSR